MCEDSSRQRHFQVFANLSSGEFEHLAMPRHRGGFSLGTIHVNGVITTLAQKFASVPLEVTNQIEPFHESRRTEFRPDIMSIGSAIRE